MVPGSLHNRTPRLRSCCIDSVGMIGTGLADTHQGHGMIKTKAGKKAEHMTATNPNQISKKLLPNKSRPHMSEEFPRAFPSCIYPPSTQLTARLRHGERTKVRAAILKGRFSGTVEIASLTLRVISQ